MRYLILFFGIVFILSACLVGAQNNKADFSGDWIFNADQSETGDAQGGGRGRGMNSTRIVIAQEENKMTEEAFRQGFDGSEMSMVYEYTLDGEKCENTSDFGTSTSVANWSEDGEMLTIQTSMTLSRGDQTFTMESTAVYSLDEDKLVIETTRSTPMGDMTSKAVYDRSEEE